MAMSMTTAIQQAFRPLFITYFFIGLGVYPVKEGKSKIVWTLYLSILYSLTVWFLCGYLWYYMISSLPVAVLFMATFTKFVIAISIVTTITSAMLSVYYNKRFMVCMQKLAAVDDTLEKLGTPKIYRKIRTWSKGVVIGWIIHSFVINCCDTLWWLDNDKIDSYWAYFIPYIRSYFFHVNIFVDLVFIFFMWYIGTRFDKVNEYMYLIVEEDPMLRRKWKKSIVNVRHVHIMFLRTNHYKRVLWSSMHLHLELCHISRELNLMFGTQMTLEMTSYLISLTSICYYVYDLQMNPEKRSMNTCFHVFFWAIIFISRVYIINYICENISVKANKIGKVIHQLTNSLRYADVWNEIYQFTLQAMHHPLKFNGMGLFYFGNEFLRKFWLTIVTFFIIIVQMGKV